MFEDLDEWVNEDIPRAITALRIGKQIMESGIKISTTRTAPAEISSFISKYENAILTAQKLHAEIDLREREIGMLNDEIDRMKNQPVAPEIAKLEAVNANLMEQLDATRKLIKESSNRAKEQIGQDTVESVVRAVWPVATITDMSADKGMSDVHVLMPFGRIVIECKNKEKIASTDVQKSNRDIGIIAEKHSDFVGYIFVSLRSPAIPTKGNIYFEYRTIGDRQIPVLWIGLTDDLKMFNYGLAAMAALVVGIKNDGMGDAETALLETVKKHIAVIAQQQKLIATIKDSAAMLQQTIEDSAARFAEYVAVADEESLNCPKCGKKYMKKHYLVKHIETCKK